jgi:hypothetical protein
MIAEMRGRCKPESGGTIEMFERQFNCRPNGIRGEVRRLSHWFSTLHQNEQNIANEEGVVNRIGWGKV